MSLGWCRTCKAPVRWEETPSGATSILNRDPVAGGNVLLVEGVALVVPKENRKPGELLYLSHFATCPQRKQHRRPKV